jgi:hypothetical protein
MLDSCHHPRGYRYHEQVERLLNEREGRRQWSAALQIHEMAESGRFYTIQDQVDNYKQKSAPTGPDSVLSDKDPPKHRIY